jgi:hypothetical protein
MFLPAILAAAFAAAPYTVATPVLDPLKLCYVTVRTGPDAFVAESVRVAGSGFTPNALVDVSFDDEVVAPGVQITSGGLLPAGFAPSPYILDGQRVFQVRVAERGEGAPSIKLESFTSALAVRVTPRRARPTSRVRFRGRGFTDRGGIYAHYLKRGKLRETVRLAKAASGACGTFDIKAPQFPFEPQMGTWRLQIDQHRRLTDDGPLINLSVDVRRRPRTR